jgi:hypothetical protein
MCNKIVKLTLIESKKIFINNYIKILRTHYNINNDNIKYYLLTKKHLIHEDILKKSNEKYLHNYPLLQKYINLRITLNNEINIGENILRNDLIDKK